MVTTYLVEGREIGIKFLFKYDLNGLISAFEVVGDAMNEKQVDWLFKLPEGALYPRFPAKETDFKERWVNDKAMQAKFTITEEPPDLSFDALWKLWAYPHGKADAKKAYGKLKRDDIIKAFKTAPAYKAWLATKNNMEHLYLSTFLNKRRFEDDFTIEQKAPAYKKEKFGRVTDNPALDSLAAKKTLK